MSLSSSGDIENNTGKAPAADAFGAAAASALGLSLGGPEVAQVVGATAAPIFARGLERLGSELEARGLSPWRKNRIRTASDFAAESMRERIAGGELPRADLVELSQDGAAGERTTAEELLEEIVNAAGDTADERKIPYLGRLYAGLLFAESISASHMRFLCKSFDALAFRQLVALAVVGEAQDAIAVAGFETPKQPAVEGRFAEYFRSVRYGRRGNGPVPMLDPGVTEELDDLASRNLIGISQAKQGEERNYEPPVSNPYELWASDGLESIWQSSFDKIRVTPGGRRFAALAGLAEGPSSERDSFLKEAWLHPS